MLLLFTTVAINSTKAQNCDTISNWDGINQQWVLFGLSSEVAINPSPNTVNPSAHCLKLITTENKWDNVSYTLAEPANFDNFHHYRVKVLAPLSGGTVTFKFQNSNNTFSHELTQTPQPGIWTDLEFDFSGMYYDGLTTLVVFYDFEGTTAGKVWYIDDVIRDFPHPELTESNLPIVVINTFGVCVADDPKISASMGIIYNGEGEINHIEDPFNDYNGNIGIETRGHSTQMFPKKSYGFETRDNIGQNLDVSLLNLPADNDWILYAPYTDKSMLRNVISFDIGRKMGDSYCSRAVYCELVLNNDYKGVYVLMEKIKKGEKRVDIATLKPDEVYGDDLTGGYILAVDWRDNDFTYNVDGWLSNPVPAYPNAMDITFQFYYPKVDEIAEAQRNYIKSYITSAEKALIGQYFTNSLSGYQKYFDVPSFVDLMLLNEITKEVDKYRLSQYFFKEKDSDGGKLHAGPAWDFNLGYGNVDYWSPGIDYTGWVYTNVQPYDYSIMYWWKRLMEDSYFRDLARTRWLDLRQNELSDLRLNSVIDSALNIINVPKNRNYERWPILGTYVWPNFDWQYNTYQDEVTYFKNFLFNRVHWMDGNLPGTPLSPYVQIWAEADKLMLNLQGDFFRNRVLKVEYFSLNNAPSGIVIQSVEYNNPSQCTLTLSGNVAGYSSLSVTVKEKAINTWHDITSNTLATASIEESINEKSFSIYNIDHKLILSCEKPEQLPQYAEIYNVKGQRIGLYRLENIKENTIDHQLKPGLYFMVLKTNKKAITLKFGVLN